MRVKSLADILLISGCSRLYFARTRVTPDVLTRIGGRKPSASGWFVIDALARSIVEAVDGVLGAVGEVRSVVKAAGASVCRMGVWSTNPFCFAG